MTKLTPAILHDTLDAGQSVSQIAASCGVTPGRVYQLMRSLGRTAHQVAAERSGKPRGTIECRTFDGYRITADGRVQSCWTTGKDARKTSYWHDVTIQINRPGTKWASLYVRLGGSGRRQRPSLLAVYRDAFGEMRQDRAEMLYERVCRRMGIE